MIETVRDEIADAFELETLLGRGVRGRRFHIAAYAAPRFRIQIIAVGFTFVIGIRVGDGEQAVVQPHFCRHRMLRADPVDRALDLAVGAGHAGARFQIQRAAQFDDLARVVLHHVVAARDPGAAQAHFAAGDQALPAFGRDFGEVFALDPQFARERHRALAEGFVLRVVREREVFFVAFGQIGEYELHRIQHRHAPRRAAVEILAQGVFQHRVIDQRILLRQAQARDEQFQRVGGIAAAADALQRRHARVAPAVDQVFLHQGHQLALAHHRVIEVQAREFDLPRLAGLERQAAIGQRCQQFGMVRQIHLVHAPVVQRAVILEFQRAQRMGDALGGVAQRMRVVVHRIDRPVVAGVLVLDVLDPVQRRVAQIDVAAGHVDLGAEGSRAIGKFARAHAPEQVEILFDTAIAERGFPACFMQRAAIGTHVICIEVADEGIALADQFLGGEIEHLEIIGSVTEFRPLVAEPAYIVLDGADVFGVFAGRVGVVKTQVAAAAEFLGDAEVGPDRPGVSQMQVAVGLRREAGPDCGLPAAGEIVANDLANEILTAFGDGVGGGSIRAVFRGHRRCRLRKPPV